jgi:hypothetical protein
MVQKTMVGKGAGCKKERHLFEKKREDSDGIPCG